LEGYRSFQKGLSARVVARAKYLGQDPNWRHHLLAPLFCLGYFYATPKRKRTAYTVLGMIIGFIWLVRQLDQPWRGIVDVGVIVGFSWGLGSFIWYGVQAFTKPDFNVSPEVPDLRPEVRLGDRPRLVFTPVVPDDEQAEPPNQANSFSPAD
jgi:hypothetical protein